MNVYPVNALEAATLISAEKAPHSLMVDLHNRYIDFQVDFTANEITIIGSWNGVIPVNAFIIGNSNAHSGKVQFISDNEILFSQEFAVNEFLKIIQVKDNFDRLDIKHINNFILTLQGTEDISIGYIYIGETWELPRFVVGPISGLNLRNESGRTFSGQTTGVSTEPLRNFGCEFVRIDNESKKRFDDYINGVQKVIPHVIDPYPEAHEEFEPFFATVQDYQDKEKRNEPRFYWNFSCSWMEAK